MFILQPLQVTRTNIKKTIPTLRDFLTIAVIHNKTVIFDINGPQSSDHPYHKGFLKLIIDVIKESHFNEEKVKILAFESSWYIFCTIKPYCKFCMVHSVYRCGGFTRRRGLM